MSLALSPDSEIVDMARPDLREHEGPDADEDVDENLHRRCHPEDPSRLIMHPLCCGLRSEERLGDGA